MRRAYEGSRGSQVPTLRQLAVIAVLLFGGYQVASLLWGTMTGPKAAQQPAAQSLPSTLVPESLVIFCIARLEAPYIEEWVLYHLHIGVDFIYIYDNEEVPTYGAMFLG